MSLCGIWQGNLILWQGNLISCQIENNDSHWMRKTGKHGLGVYIMFNQLRCFTLWKFEVRVLSNQ